MEEMYLMHVCSRLCDAFVGIYYRP
jgi:hypothetical protein